MDAEGQDRYLSTTLEKLSAHLDFLSGQIFVVEEELGNLISGHDDVKNLSITKLQSLDFTRQSLEDCALLLCFLSNNHSTERHVIADAETIQENLKLEVTRKLLADHDRVDYEATSGNIDFF